MAAKKQTIIDITEPVIRSLGYELWGIELLGQNRVTLRIYIDSPNGIDVDDCAKVSRQVSSVLDVEDPVSGEYTLEVSSPGMDRPLFQLSHYTLYIGHVVKIRLRTPYDGRRNFTGQITSVEGQDVVIHVDGYEYLLPFSSIEKAYIMPDFR